MSDVDNMKVNDLSNSRLRKKYLEQEFTPETHYAVAMGRVSTKKQKGEAHHSDRAQLETIERYVQLEKLEFVREPWDVAETASKHERRKNFQEMIDFVKASQNTAKAIKHVVFSHQSRSNRNRESARALESLLALGVTLHFARDGRKLCSQSDLEDLLLWDVNNILNEKHIKDHTKNVMDGVIKRVEMGLFPGKAPFGYRNHRPHENALSVFVKEPLEAAYVVRAFEMFSTGRYSELALKGELDREFPHLPRKPDARRFSDILRNRFYHGEFVYDGHTYTGHPEHHPRLISFDLWNTVQQVLKNPGRSKRRVTQRGLPYIGLIKCGGRILDAVGQETDETCGCTVTGEEKRKVLADGTTKRYYFWHCSSTRKCSQRNKAFMAGQGRGLNYSETEIESLLGRVLTPLTYTPEIARWMQDVLLEEHRHKSTAHREETEALARRLGMLRTYIDRAYEDKLNGLIVEGMWREKNDTWNSEIAEITRRMESLDGQKQEYILRGVQLIELVKDAETLYKKAPAEKKRALIEMLSSNHVLRNGSIEFSYRKPFDLLAAAHPSSKWWS